MSDITLYHNPRCSKSRLTLALLQEKGLEPAIRLYLETPPSREELLDVLKKLDISPRELMRKGEDEYKNNNLKDPALTDEQLIDALLEFPRLIERPIAITKAAARIGRPPENVLDIL